MKFSSARLVLGVCLALGVSAAAQSPTPSILGATVRQPAVNIPPTPSVVVKIAEAAAPTLHKLTWYKRFDDAQHEAREQDKPLVILFSTPWCQYCRVLEREVLSSPEFSALADQVVLARLEPDIVGGEGEAMARSLHVTGYPTIVVMYAGSGSPKETARVIGYYPMREFLGRIDKGIASWAEKDRKEKKHGR
jgi:thioredoxin-related protein